MNENLEKFKNFIATKDETLLDGQNSNIQDVEDKAFIMEYLRKSSRGTTTYNDLCDVRLIGERLHQVKKRRRQGQFIPWVRQEFFGVAGLRQLQYCMKLYELWDEAKVKNCIARGITGVRPIVEELLMDNEAHINRIRKRKAKKFNQMKNFSTVNGIESQRPPAGDIATPYECQVKRFKEMPSSISPGCRGFITSSHDFDSEEMISVAEDMIKKVIEFIEHIRG